MVTTLFADNYYIIMHPNNQFAYSLKFSSSSFFDILKIVIFL